MRKFLFIAFAAGLAGCATPSTGIVPIGSGQYMASKMGEFTTFSGSQVKAELWKEAAAFCAKSGKQLVPGNSTAQDSSYGKYASAEVQFACS